MSIKARLAVAALAAVVALPLLAVKPVSAATPAYGCFKVTGASSINIHRRPWSFSEIIGVASKGEVLVKWKRFCSLRGFWCPVQKGGIVGHADKSFLTPVPCK